MSFDVENLSVIDLDKFKEIGNIGAGNAATSLSKLLNKRINMNVPEVKLINLENAVDIIGGAETLVAGVYVDFKGDIQGTILYLLDSTSLSKLLELLMNKETDTQISELNDIEASAIIEVANIMSGSYLMALSSFTGLKAVHSVPNLSIDMAGAILSVPVIEYGAYGDKTLFIESQLTDGTEQINNYFFLIPGITTCPVLLKALEVGT
ncbi:MAG TPA: chemotaxis protein CheC [Candidatus Atribacteria bacterium]|nr:chemotaxis protein CheC [Candidatus Atribacteria bacterium]